MKELSIEEKAKYYDEVRRKIAIRFGSNVADEIFSQFEMSEDERIRKALKEYFINSFQNNGVAAILGVHIKDIFAWLEKKRYSEFELENEYWRGYDDAKMHMEEKQREQAPKHRIGDIIKYNQKQYTVIGIDTENHCYDLDNNECVDFNTADTTFETVEQKPYGQREECSDCEFSCGDKCIGSCAMKRGEEKPADKVEPKFKVGDWVVNNEHNNVAKILEVNEQYRLDYCDTIGTVSVELIDNDYHLWTIQDAKDGDVLIANAPFIFNGNLEGGIGCPGAHCGINTLGKFQIPKNKKHWTGHTTTPATKEQCDLLFQKMKEAGYEWDTEHKQLKKIKHKPAWSEEDEKMLEKVIMALSAYADKLQYTGFCHNKTVIQEYIDWLKSFRPKYHWKPSKEQMKALEMAINEQKEEYGFTSLDSLYERLKAL